MARRPRINLPGATYHVGTRGVRKLPIFEDDVDRRLFWKIVDETVTRYDLRIYEACQMGNHYHFVIETPRGNLSDAMRFLNGEHARKANRRHGRCGHLFDARFDAQLIHGEAYLRRACRYVVLNPVKARMVHGVGDWKWSTYRATAGFEEAPSWLHTKWIDVAFKATSREESQQRYRAYVNQPAGLKTRIPRDACAFGPPKFVAAVADAMRGERDVPLPRRPRLPPRVDLAVLFANNDRDAAIYEAHVTYGYLLTEIAAFLGVHRVQVSRGLQRYRSRNPKSES
jgi:REP element-mobilizing transposase RayT